MNPHTYAAASESYAALGVDTEKALKTLETVALSLHCWQGDDVAGSGIAGRRTERRWYPR